jgi:hypothetical protein
MRLGIGDFFLQMTNDIPQNQMAHEVTRDVTAWAFLISLRRPFLASNRFCRQPAPGPGPASVRSA